MADQSKSSGKQVVPSYRAMSLQEEHQMLSASKAASTSSGPRDPAPAPSPAAERSQATPFAQIFPGQPGNPIDADHPPPLIPTSVLARMVGLPVPSRRSRRMRGIAPGDIPPAIPRSQSGPRCPTPLERMNLVDTENIGTDSDDEDYVPPAAATTSSFLPELSPEEIEAINLVAPPPNNDMPAADEAQPTDDASVPADDRALVVFEAQPSTVVSPPDTDVQATSTCASPEIPHVDFFSEENTGPSQPSASVPINPQSIHEKVDEGDSSSESSDWEESLANYVLKKRTNEGASQSAKESDGNVVGNATNMSEDGDSSDSSFEEADAAGILTSMPGAHSSSSDDVDQLIDAYASEDDGTSEDDNASGNDVNIVTITPHSHKFLTAEAEAKFADLMERSMIEERRIMLDVFKKHNLIDFFESKGMLSTVTTAVPFVRAVVCEFYANLIPQVFDKNSVSYGQAYVRGHFHSFTPEKINLMMGTDDYQGSSTVDDMDEAVNLITRGKVRMWQEKLSAAKLTSMYSVLHKITVCNWLPSKNSTIVTRPQAQLLYRLGMGIKFNFGQMVFDCVRKLTLPNSGASLVFPSIIYNLLELQYSVALEDDIFTGDPGTFTIRTHLMRGDRLCDLPWVDRRENVAEGGAGSSAGNIFSNFCQFSRSDVEAHISRLEGHIVQLDAQKNDLQLLVDALKASLLPSGQGGENEDDEDADSESEDVADIAGNLSDDEEDTASDNELEAKFERIRKGKGKVKEKGKRKRAAEEETPLRRSSRHRRN